jgi:hypothetical protein
MLFIRNENGSLSEASSSFLAVEWPNNIRCSLSVHPLFHLLGDGIVRFFE